MNQAGLIGGQSRQAHRYSHIACCSQQSQRSQRIGNQSSEPIEEQTTINLQGCYWRTYNLQGRWWWLLYFTTMVNTYTTAHHGEHQDKRKQHLRFQKRIQHVKDIIVI